MIDLKDEKQKYYCLGKCMTRKPIDFYGVNIYPPIIGDIFDMGEDNYKELLTPFILSNEYLKLPNTVSLLEDVYLFDNYMSELLKLSLSYFMKLKKEDFIIFKPENKNGVKGKIIIQNAPIIQNDKFNELKALIQMMCNVKELTKADMETLDKSEYKFKDEESRRKYEEFLKEKNKALGKSETIDKRVKLVNVYDYVVHAQSNINYDIPLEWSIYQLYNSYQNLHMRDNIQFTYDVASNGMLSSKEKLKTLSEEIAK